MPNQFPPVHSPAAGITFKNTQIINPDDALIQFIKDHTGKMKPLAAADLERSGEIRAS